jgi:hypothetical protein
MKNLRITTKSNWIDQYGTGDREITLTFEVRRDFTEAELNRKIKYSNEVIQSGVIIETFQSADNANIFMKALELKERGENSEFIKKDLLASYMKKD